MKLVLNGIHKKFGEKEVLKGASYKFEPGKIYGLLGRNGSGKTTLFKVIYGDFEDFTGEVLLADDAEDITRKLEPAEVGMIFSEPMIPEFLTGYEFIKFYIEAHGKENVKIDELFQRLEFPLDDAKRLVKGYSSGMRAKIHIMALLISQPPVMLLDEPLTSLDVVAAAEIKKILMDFRKDHIIIMSTHIMQLAKDMCDEIVLLKDGKLEGLEGLDRNAPEYEERIIAALTDKDGSHV